MPFVAASGVNAALRREREVGKPLTMDEKDFIQQVMRRYDTNNSGALNIAELQAMLDELNGEPVKNAEALYLMGKCDANHDGAISIDELFHLIEEWYVNSLDHELRELGVLHGENVVQTAIDRQAAGDPSSTTTTHAPGHTVIEKTPNPYASHHDRVGVSSGSKIKPLDRLEPDQQEFIKVVLKKYDRNNSGKLDIRELADLLLDLNHGTPLSAKEVRTLLGAADDNLDGSIDVNELYGLLEKWYLSRDNPELLTAQQCNLCSIM